jgi:hypothetical protein
MAEQQPQNWQTQETMKFSLFLVDLVLLENDHFPTFCNINVFDANRVERWMVVPKLIQKFFQASLSKVDSLTSSQQESLSMCRPERNGQPHF